MSCSKCHTKTCGCKDTPYTTATIPDNCVTPPACSEYINFSCLVYNGPQLQDGCIIPGMTMNQVLQRLILWINDSNASPEAECVTCQSGVSSIDDLTVLAITATTIKIGWTPITGATSQVPMLDSVDQTSISSTANNYTFTSLTPDTTYLINLGTVFSGPSTCPSLNIYVKTSE